MSRLVVISNRVQSVDAPSGNQGGLAVALLAALREKGGVWFGWSGATTETFTGHINFQQGKGVTTATIDLDIVKRHRAAFGFFRDRRPYLYGRLVADV